MIALVFQKYLENFALQLFIVLQLLTRKICYFLKKCLLFNIVFSVYKQNLRLNNLKTRTAMNAKVSVFVICVEVIIYIFII